MALTKVPSSMLVLPLDTGEGSAVASAGTIDLDAATGNYLHITGTTTITAITLAQGAVRWVVFDGVLTLTHSATLILPGAVDIITAAGDVAQFVGEGGGVTRCLVYIRSATPAGGGFSGALVHVREEQTTGTNGGTFTAGARRTRALNTVKTNEISGVSLASNEITGLPAGTYYAEFSCTCAEVANHRSILRNVTASSDLLLGTSQYSDTSINNVDMSRGCGRFTLSATSTVSLQHICSSTRASIGFGFAANLGVTEVYSELLIWKLT